MRRIVITVTPKTDPDELLQAFETQSSSGSGALSAAIASNVRECIRDFSTRAALAGPGTVIQISRSIDAPDGPIVIRLECPEKTTLLAKLKRLFKG